MEKEKVFQKAKAIWGEGILAQYNQFLGFYTRVEVFEEQEITLVIAARSYYRLYIDGKMIASGPARTAHGYCRADRIPVRLHGAVKVAVEVAAFDKPGKYSNDCTLEPGLLTAEILDEKGKVLSATGEHGWKYIELVQRRSLVETMSHSRGVIEYYDLEPGSDDWKEGTADWKKPVCVAEEPQYLERRAPYPDYHKIPLKTMSHICDMTPMEEGEKGRESFTLGLATLFNRDWYESLPAENCFLASLGREKETAFSGAFCLKKEKDVEGQTIQKIEVTPGKTPAAVMWSMEESELGFLDFEISVEKECVVDVLNCDHLHVTGWLKENTYVSRYHLQPGAYHLTTFEPKLTRYVKLILRTEGKVELTYPKLLDDSYPEDGSCFFQCSDGDLNRIYEASKKTLRMNTLDIFMDCPQRERGGWLCDSLFSARGAWQMFGDLSVEKDFLENFMLTDGKAYERGFFPEVYPGRKQKMSDIGISNWSFWLLLELEEYVHRSGDRAFVEKSRERVSACVEGMLSYRGESGLLENLPNQFVDWSIANKPFNLYPISVANNCLAVYALEKMAELYGVENWKKAAEEMRSTIGKIEDVPVVLGGGGDGVILKDGKLHYTGCRTEGAAALELFSGFNETDRRFMNAFLYQMGPAPTLCKDPNVGGANVCMGHLIRFLVLANMGRVDLLLKEWKEMYLQELRVGSGTFFENYSEISGCHGANGIIGALMTQKVLGLGAPMQEDKSVTISPYPGELLWAYGSAKCEDGMIFLRWSADRDLHELKMDLTLPEGWKAKYEIPFELNGWTVTVNGKSVNDIK